MLGKMMMEKKQADSEALLHDPELGIFVLLFVCFYLDSLAV